VSTSVLRYLRTYCLWTYLAVFTPIASILAILVSPFDRLGLTKHANHFTNFPTLYWSRGLIAAANSGLERIGVLPAKDAPYVIASNHRSHLDGPALLWALRPISFRFLVKFELLYVPIMGPAFWAIGMVFVKRGNRASAEKSVAQVVGRIQAGENIVVFPEGTRSRGLDGSKMLPFKKGAFIMAQKGGVPILPVGIAGSAEIYGYGWFARQWRGHIVIKAGPSTQKATARTRSTSSRRRFAPPSRSCTQKPMPSGSNGQRKRELKCRRRAPSASLFIRRPIRRTYV